MKLGYCWVSKNFQDIIVNVIGIRSHFKPKIRQLYYVFRAFTIAFFF